MIKTFIVSNENYDVDKINEVICKFLNIDNIPYLDTRFIFHPKNLEKLITGFNNTQILNVLLSDNIIALDYINYKDCYIIDKEYSIKPLLEYDLVMNMLYEGLNLSGLYLAGYFE
jgi:hypothetical protein